MNKIVNGVANDYEYNLDGFISNTSDGLKIYQGDVLIKTDKTLLIEQLQQESKRLEDNWNKLKEYLKTYIKLMNDKPDMIEQGQIDILYEVKDMMQELEEK